MNYTLTKNTEGKVTEITIDGTTYKLKTPKTTSTLNESIRNQISIELSDGSYLNFKGAGGTAGTNPALLSYIIENNKLTGGTELTTTSVPSTPGAKGFLTGTAQTALLNFYKAFGYNDVNYKLMVGDPRIEVSFKAADRRSGVAGTRTGWSKYFKLADLMKSAPVQIINNLTGTDTTAGYNIQAQITKNAAGSLFLTLTDTHSGNNLYGSIVNIRHRVV